MITDWRDTLCGPQMLEEAYDMICFAHEEMLEIANKGTEIKDLGLYIDRKEREFFYDKSDAYANSEDIILLKKIKYEKSDNYANKNKTRRKFVNQEIMDNRDILRKIKIDFYINNFST